MRMKESIIGRVIFNMVCWGSSLWSILQNLSHQAEYEYKLHQWTTFQNFCHAVLNIIEEYINKAYHDPGDLADS